jgi:hypothetical protein
MTDGYEKIGDKETETPADAPKVEDAAEKKGEGTQDDGQSLEQAKKVEEEVDKKLKEKQTQLEQLNQSVNDETEKLRALREERRDLGYKPMDNNETDPTDDVEPGDDAKKAAIDIFFTYHPEYRPENDPGNKLYGELDRHFKRLRPGTNVSEVVDTLEYIHKTFIKKDEAKPAEEAKPDVSIGDTSSDPTPKNKTSALTRKLNKDEAEAAKFFPGGEDAYRKKLAEREG